MAPKKVLFSASVVKTHILQFHLPLIKWFADKGFEVHVCAKNDMNGQKIDIPFCTEYFDIPFSRSPFSADNICAYKAVKRLADENDYELIICNTPVAAFITRLAVRAARKRGTKVIYICHGFHFFKGAPLSNQLYRIPERIAAGYTDAIITVNHEDYEAACRFGCKSYFVHGIGVDTGKIMSMTGERASLRREFGIPEDCFLLMSLSEIISNKNVTCAVEAFARACGSRKDMYYLAVGWGPALEECKSLAQRLGAADRVIFAGYRFDALRLYQMADAFISPSKREGLGLSNIEAMAAGLPLISSDIRGIREYAVNGENSLLFRPDDTEGFASAITMLYEDKELRHRLGKAARTAALSYDIDISMKEITEIFCKMAGMEEGETEKWEKTTI